MCAWIIPPIAGLIETAIAPEFYIDGIGAAEILDGCIRYYLYSDQMPLEVVGAAQKIVAFKAVAPVMSIPKTMAQLAQCLVGVRSPDVPLKGPRLVR